MCGALALVLGTLVPQTQYSWQALKYDTLVLGTLVPQIQYSWQALHKHTPLYVAQCMFLWFPQPLTMVSTCDKAGEQVHQQGIDVYNQQTTARTLA